MAVTAGDMEGNYESDRVQQGIETAAAFAAEHARPVDELAEAPGWKGFEVRTVGEKAVNYSMYGRRVQYPISTGRLLLRHPDFDFIRREPPFGQYPGSSPN